MTRAMVNVLPDPVTPSSTWCLSPRLSAVDQFALRARLIASQLEVGDELEVVGQGGHVTSGMRALARIPNRTTRQRACRNRRN